MTDLMPLCPDTARYRDGRSPAGCRVAHAWPDSGRRQVHGRGTLEGGGASIASAIADSGPNAGPSARGGPAIVPHPRNPAASHAGHAHGDLRAVVVQTESDLGWAQYDLPERADSAAGVMRLLGQYPNYCGGGKAATRSLPSRSLPGETAPSLVRRMVQGTQEAMGRSGRFAHASGDSSH